MDAVRFGRQIRALRRRRGWRQLDLATASKISRATIARLELGAADRLPARVLDAVAGALAARVTVTLSWNGEALDRLLDEGHAAMVEELTRRLIAAGWLVAVEASFSVYGERGSIDMLAYHAPTRTLLVVEVKSVVPDLQATLMALDRRTRLAPQLGTDRGWAPARVARLLVLPENRTARRRVARHTATLVNTFPLRGVALNQWLRTPDARRSASGLLFLASVHVEGTRHRIQVRNGPQEPIPLPRVSRGGQVMKTR